MSLLDYENRFSNLRMNTRNGTEKSPHKVAMLLGIIDLIEREIIARNRIYFDQTLKNAFTVQFIKLAGPHDRDNPHLPYFHLRTSGFWHHQVKPGKSEVFDQLKTLSGPAAVDDYIEYVYLDDELFELLNNDYACALLKVALLQNLQPEERKNLLGSHSGWDWLECEAVVQDYFAMLNNELSGHRYSKAAHRRRLLPKLNARSEGSIEYKHQNISAVLVGLGLPYIKGYKPAFNYQRQLEQVVMAYLAAHPGELQTINRSGDMVIEQNGLNSIDWTQVYDPEPPEGIAGISEPPREFLARQVNFSEREQHNRNLGRQGEEFVLEFERRRLEQSGRTDLAREVEWSSRDKGDGLGYDIRSFDLRGEKEHFIEVKTTSSGKYQPFYISDNELSFSKEFSDSYSLYRVYQMFTHPRYFQLQGPVDQYVHLHATSYKASFS